MSVVLFDVNETLLDLGPVHAFLDDRYDGAVSSQDWFRELLRLAFVSAAIDRYEPFTELGGAALAGVASRAGRNVEADDRTAIADVLRTLPPHDDVVPGLTALAEGGVTIAAVTNSPLPTARAQLDNAGIAEYFDRIMSVDGVRRFKPHRSVYLWACAELDAPPAATTMVAAHDWDIAGAMAAGLRGVFVGRPGQTWSPAFGEPDVAVSDIEGAAASILATD